MLPTYAASQVVSDPPSLQVSASSTPCLSSASTQLKAHPKYSSRGSGDARNNKIHCPAVTSNETDNVASWNDRKRPIGHALLMGGDKRKSLQSEETEPQPINYKSNTFDSVTPPFQQPRMLVKKSESLETVEMETAQFQPSPILSNDPGAANLPQKVCSKGNYPALDSIKQNLDTSSKSSENKGGLIGTTSCEGGDMDHAHAYVPLNNWRHASYSDKNTAMNNIILSSGCGETNNDQTRDIVNAIGLEKYNSILADAVREANQEKAQSLKRQYGAIYDALSAPIKPVDFNVGKAIQALSHSLLSSAKPTSTRRPISETNHSQTAPSALSHVLLASAKFNVRKNTTVMPGRNNAGTKLVDRLKQSAVCYQLPANPDVTRQQLNGMSGTSDVNNLAMQQPTSIISGPTALNHQQLSVLPGHQLGYTNVVPTIPPMASAGIDLRLRQPAMEDNLSLPVPMTPTPVTISHQSTTNHAHVSTECCSHNLNPAPIPRNPLDDMWNETTPLEKEVAWLVEESIVILPSLGNDTASKDKPLLLVCLEFAWRHGSLQLRKKMLQIFPSKLNILMKSLNVGKNDTVDESGARLTLVDGYDLLWPGQEKSLHESHTAHDNNNFDNLRKEACNALQLGFRRSESVERELNVIRGFRWREAVEEVGKPGDSKDYEPPRPKQSRHRRKRLKTSKDEAIVKTALGQDNDSSPSLQSSPQVEILASQIPSELTPLEDEIAWLVEESLILIPEGMLSKNGSPTDVKNTKQTESIVSAGLVTKSCDINWDYVSNNASELLEEKFKSMGGLRRRPLQRIIRYHHREVRCAFANRRSDIASLLLLQGYRRNATKKSLPSHELLVQTGLHNVWAVKLMRRRQNERKEETISSADLRSACNARFGDKEHLLENPRRQKKKKCPSNASAPPKNSQKKPQKKIVKLTATQKATSLMLTAGEEEIAWLREEFQLEHGVKGYDWEYIEQNSSLPLLIDLAERKCASSSFPDVAGVSKLQTMVRLNIHIIKESYEQKRKDIRFAITHSGFRRDRSKHLPIIPSAPASFDAPLVRKNGTSVLDVKYACHDDNGGVICIDDDSEEDVNACRDDNGSVICIDDDSGEDVDENPCEKTDSSQDINCREDVGECASMDKEEEPNVDESHSPDDGASSVQCAKISSSQDIHDHKDGSGDDLVDKEEDVITGESHPLADSIGNACGDGPKEDDENASAALSSRSFSSESVSASDEEQDGEVDPDDDEYELSSEDESDDDIIED